MLGELFRPFRSHADAPAGAIQLGRLVDAGGEALDEAVVARAPGGAIEINIHGGPVVAQAVLQRLGDLGAAIEPARTAATESFGAAHPRWNNPAIGAEMLDVLPDAASEFVVAAISQQWSAGLSKLACDPDTSADALRAAAGRFEVMRKLQSPPEVVLVGPPNVGKSTLANALVGRAASIVHETPGTTRDWVRELALLEGVPIWLTDTAGLFEFPDDPHGIDAEAVRRARCRAEQADLVLLLSAGENPTETPDWLHAKNILRIAAKCDLYPRRGGAPVPPRSDVEEKLAGQEPRQPQDACDHFEAVVSAETGEGLDELARSILTALGLARLDPATPAAFTKRQAELLIAAAEGADAENGPAAKEYIERLLREQQVARPTD